MVEEIATVAKRLAALEVEGVVFVGGATGRPPRRTRALDPAVRPSFT